MDLSETERGQHRLGVEDPSRLRGPSAPAREPGDDGRSDHRSARHLAVQHVLDREGERIDVERRDLAGDSAMR